MGNITKGGKSQIPATDKGDSLGTKGGKTEGLTKLSLLDTKFARYFYAIRDFLAAKNQCSNEAAWNIEEGRISRKFAETVLELVPELQMGGESREKLLERLADHDGTRSRSAYGAIHALLDKIKSEATSVKEFSEAVADIYAFLRGREAPYHESLEELHQLHDATGGIPQEAYRLFDRMYDEKGRYCLGKFGDYCDELMDYVSQQQFFDVDIYEQLALHWASHTECDGVFLLEGVLGGKRDDMRDSVLMQNFERRLGDLRSTDQERVKRAKEWFDAVCPTDAIEDLEKVLGG